MALQFTTVDASTHSNGAKCLVYGGAGMGKTVLMATMPNPVVLSAEQGLLSLRKANLERLHGVNNPTICYNAPVIVINSVQDLTDAYAWCTQSHEARNFQSVGIDSISEIAEVVLNNAKKQVKDPRQAYGELIEKMETVIRSFRDLQGKNVCMLAKMEPMKDELTGVVKYVPSMPGAKLAVKLPYFFDEVFRLGVNKAQDGTPYRYLQTQPEMQYEAKDRSGALAAIEPPNLTHIFSKILGV